MLTPISSIIRASTRQLNEKLNILTIPGHERWESNLAKSGHEFYAFRTQDGSTKDWDTTYAPVPDNYHLLDPKLGNNQIPEWLDLDLVLAHNKFGQFQILSQIASQLYLPLIQIEHTLPYESHWPQSYIQSLKKMKGQANVFISEYSRDRWLWNEDEAIVIPHGVDSEIFRPLYDVPRRNHILCVVNDFINRDLPCGYRVFEEVTKGLNRFILGNTPGLSRPAKDLDELVYRYNESAVFLNTSQISPIPMSLLEAMACGRACVSSKTAAIPEIIENGVNGFITNDKKEMRHYLEMCLEDPYLCRKLGEAARQTILERFSLDKFVNNWNKVFYETANTIRKDPNETELVV